MTCADSKERTDKIARLNDAFRTSLTGGRIMVTRGVTALDRQTQADILHAVKAFNAFTPDNDPHGEHDFGFIKVGGHDLFWKIDYYDPTLSHHTKDATNPDVTRRVLTIMLTEEY